MLRLVLLRDFRAVDQHQALVDVVRYLTEPFRVIARLAGVVFDVVWSDHLTVSNGHAASDLLTSATYGVGPMPDKALQLPPRLGNGKKEYGHCKGH